MSPGEICLEEREAGSVAFTGATGRTPALVHLRSDLEAARSQAIPNQVSRLLGRRVVRHDPRARGAC
jgi:hypothetical protein